MRREFSCRPDFRRCRSATYWIESASRHERQKSVGWNSVWVPEADFFRHREKRTSQATRSVLKVFSRRYDVVKHSADCPAWPPFVSLATSERTLAARSRFQPATFSRMLENIAGRPRTRSRSSPVARFRMLFVASIPPRTRYVIVRTAGFTQLNLIARAFVTVERRIRIGRIADDVATRLLLHHDFLIDDFTLLFEHFHEHQISRAVVVFFVTSVAFHRIREVFRDALAKRVHAVVIQ